MTREQLKSRIGLFLIISHFMIILLVVALFLFGGFKFEEMTTAVALIVPMFSIYTTAIIKHITTNSKQKKDSSEIITGEFVFITFFVPSLLIFFLISMIILKTLNVGFSDFEQFKIMLAISETVFGAYVGLVMSSLFEIKPQSEKGKNSSRRLE